MKTSLIIAIVVLLTAAAHSETLQIKGELTVNSGGIAQLLECGTGRHLEFGVMASAPYFNLTKRHKEISGDANNPVLVVVDGILTRASGGKLVLNSPRVVSITPGRCGNG